MAHICHVYPSFLTIKGGVERHLEGLVKYQVRRGHKVTVHTLEKPSSCKCYEGAIVKQWGSVYHGLWHTYHVSEADIIHVHGYRDQTMFSDTVEILARIHKKPVAFTAHGIYPHNSTLDHIKKEIYDATLGRWKLRCANATIALTEDNRQQLLKLGARNVFVVPNSVDFQRFQNLPTSNAFSQKFDLHNERIVLYVGRIDWNKGLEYAIKALGCLKEEGENVKLAIVGRDFGYGLHLRHLAQAIGVDSNVIFTGEVDETTLLSAYKESCAFVLPSVYEGLPTVVLEALACGLPPIAARTGGTGSVIEDKVTGMLVEYGNSLQIASAILELLRNDELRATIKRKGKETVEEQYSWAANVKKIEHVYEFARNDFT